ncbi:MAG: MBL fold metallo-hydrolase [Chloroflexi bacterium]|nr:MBL fold metallo-hydrolase [Chloroflexota bacterium]
MNLNHKSDLVFLGTGTSEGVPRVSCLTRDPVTCPVCSTAVEPGSKNRRRNTSLLVRYAHPDGRVRNIVIDTGKFFWHSALEWFPRYRVPTIDAVVLTHAHADAAGGLDDLRDWTNNVQHGIPVYLRKEDIEVIGKTFFYLIDPTKATSAGGVSRLGFQLIDESPFDVQGLRFIPLPVWHGKPYSAFGYRFGSVSYLSDVSEIPPETVERMIGTELLILDALRPRRPHGSHLTLEQAIDHVRALRPKRALFTDMTHDYDHEHTNNELQKLKASEGLDIQLAFDGLLVEAEL